MYHSLFLENNLMQSFCKKHVKHHHRLYSPGSEADLRKTLPTHTSLTQKDHRGHSGICQSSLWLHLGLAASLWMVARLHLLSVKQKINVLNVCQPPTRCLQTAPTCPESWRLPFQSGLYRKGAGTALCTNHRWRLQENWWVLKSAKLLLRDDLFYLSALQWEILVDKGLPELYRQAL